MRTIIIQYEDDDPLNHLIEKTLTIERSSKTSLAKRSIISYCKKIVNENAKPKLNT